MNIADDLRGWVSAWWGGAGGPMGRVASVLTLPLEAGFRAASGARGRLYDTGRLRVHRAPVPVISVGNLTIGGTGKTPVAAWVARTLKQGGRTPSILLRGYGADEVAVHRELNPQIRLTVGADRVRGAAEAFEEGADCLVLDDGFQHRRLHRDLDIVLLAAEQWNGRQRLLPRGPWREPLQALRRAGFILVTRKAAASATGESLLERLSEVAPSVPAGLVHLVLSDFFLLEGGAEDREAVVPPRSGERVTALSSLGTPAAFEGQLEEMGALVTPLRYPDHHEFTSEDVRSIVQQAAGTRIVMTRKEAVKLRGKLPVDAGALIAGQKLVFDRGEDMLERIIRRTVSSR